MIDGIEDYKGLQIHSGKYQNPEKFIGLKTLVVGEGNSGAQIVAELSKVTSVKWSTKKEPEFLPDDVDGYYLFTVASARYKAEKEGKPFDSSQYNLGNIVMVPTVKEAKQEAYLYQVGHSISYTIKGLSGTMVKKRNLMPLFGAQVSVTIPLILNHL